MKTHAYKLVLAGAALAGLIAVLSNGAVNAQNTFESPQDYIEVRLTSDVLSNPNMLHDGSSYQVQGGLALDDDSFNDGSNRYKVPLESGPGVNDWLLHGPTSIADPFLVDFASYAGVNYNTGHLTARMGSSEGTNGFAPAGTRHVDRPVKILGQKSGDSWKTTLITNNGLIVRGDAGFPGYLHLENLYLPGFNTVAAYVSNADGGAIIGCWLNAVMQYDAANTLRLEDNIFTTPGTAIAITNNSSGAELTDSVVIEGNRFVGNDIAIDLIDGGIDAGGVLSEGNNSFEGVTTAIHVRVPSTDEQDLSYAMGNYWEPAGVKSGAGLTDPQAILDTLVDGEAPGQVDVGGALASNPNLPGATPIPEVPTGTPLAGWAAGALALALIAVGAVYAWPTRRRAV